MPSSKLTVARWWVIVCYVSQKAANPQMVFVYRKIESQCSFTFHCISHFIWIRPSNLCMVFLFRNNSSEWRNRKKVHDAIILCFAFYNELALCIYKLHWFSNSAQKPTRKLLFTIILRELTNAISFDCTVTFQAQIPRKLSGKLSRCCFSHCLLSIADSYNRAVVQFHSIANRNAEA